MHTQITKKIEKRKGYSPFIDNIWCADLADIQLIRKSNKLFRFLVCVIESYRKYAWVIPLKDEKGITITNAFQSILNESKRKANKKWIYKGSEFYYILMKSFLQNNDLEMYSKHNEGKSVTAERFIKNLRK